MACRHQKQWQDARFVRQEPIEEKRGVQAQIYDLGDIVYSKHSNDIRKHHVGTCPRYAQASERAGGAFIWFRRFQ